MPRLRLVLLSLLSSFSLAACGTTPEGEGGEETETGDEPAMVTLVVDTDASSVCGDAGGPITFETRRVDCFDPALPCTVAQDPPWIAGTTDSCDTLAPGVARWQVVITQTGRWETRLEAGGEIQCFGVGGQARTDVSRDDLASGAELMLQPAPAGECGEP